MIDSEIPKEIENSLINLINYENEENYEPTLFQNSPYYDRCNFIKMLKSKNNILKILSLNCQSLNSKYDELNIFLDQCFDQGCKIDIICLQETWIATGTDISLFNIANYKFISSEKSCSEHGGIAIYIHESLKSKIIHESVNSKFYDGQFIEATINNETKK